METARDGPEQGQGSEYEKTRHHNIGTKLIPVGIFLHECRAPRRGGKTRVRWNMALPLKIVVPIMPIPREVCWWRHRRRPKGCLTTGQNVLVRIVPVRSSAHSVQATDLPPDSIHACQRCATQRSNTGRFLLWAWTSSLPWRSMAHPSDRHCSDSSIGGQEPKMTCLQADHNGERGTTLHWRHRPWGRFRTARAQRAHSANYYGDYPGNNPENHPPSESCTTNSKLKNPNI